MKIGFNKTIGSLHKQQIMSKNQNNIITFSTCWYIMKSKFAIDKYIIWIKNLLSIVNNFNLVIYTDINSLNSIKYLIDYTNKKIKIIIKPITEFYTYKYKNNWIKNHDSSTMELHKHIDWQLNMLWNEKVFFVEETIKKQYFKSQYYGWCDIGYFRNNPDDINTIFLNKWPNNVKIINNTIKQNCVNYGCIQDNIEIYNSLSNEIKEHYKNELKTPPTNKYTENCFAGGFFILKQETCKYYSKLYDEKLEYYFCNDFFIKDDQFIIMDIIFTNPELFYIHRENNSQYNNWFMFQRLFL